MRSLVICLIVAITSACHAQRYESIDGVVLESLERGVALEDLRWLLPYIEDEDLRVRFDSDCDYLPVLPERDTLPEHTEAQWQCIVDKYEAAKYAYYNVCIPGDCDCWRDVYTLYWYGVAACLYTGEESVVIGDDFFCDECEDYTPCGFCADRWRMPCPGQSSWHIGCTLEAWHTYQDALEDCPSGDCECQATAYLAWYHDSSACWSAR